MDIYMATRERLLSLDCIEGIAIRVVELKLSRLGSTSWLAHTIYSFEGTIFDWNGVALDQSESGPDYIEDAYGFDEACTWNSAVRKFAHVRPVRRPRESMLLRLGLWDAAFKIIGQPIFE
jgi:hypothetical protein